MPTAGGEGSAVPGTLYVVATPIGNLGDLSARAADVLRRAGAIVAEDTRRTRQLLAHLDAPSPPLLSLPAFDERNRLGPVLERLARGEEVALCTDAGTPGVSDPGQQLVAAAWEIGARVVPVPGPCAAVTALVASGLPSDRFLVQGFLPRSGKGREEALTLLRHLPVTAVIYEAGNRTGATLADLAAALGDRDAAVGRELTKLHEEIARGTLRELADRFADGARGEVTIVVAPGAAGAGVEGAAPEGAPGVEPLEDELRRRSAAGEAPSAIAREVARSRGLKRAEVYAALEKLRKG
jgi:16S rRNA (cytidine1402-2'-O)-methyltransferase